jgi:hypothetical protein
VKSGWPISAWLLMTGDPGGKANFILILGISLFGVTKEVVGITKIATRLTGAT